MFETEVFAASRASSAGEAVSSRWGSACSLSEARLFLVNLLLFAGLKAVLSTASGAVSMLSSLNLQGNMKSSEGKGRACNEV